MAKRRRFSAEFKARVVRDAMREGETLSAVAGRHGVHANLVREWRKQADASMLDGFRNGTRKGAEGDAAKALKDAHAKIGELTLERDFFVVCSVAEQAGTPQAHRQGLPAQHRQAVQAAWRVPQSPLPLRAADAGAGSVPHALHRREALAAPCAWQPADEAGAGTGWREGRAAQGAPPHGGHGCSGGRAQACHQRSRARPQGLSLSAAGHGRHRGEPGVVRGYHLHPRPRRVHVPGGRHGLGLALRPVVALVELHGIEVLPGRPRRGPARPSRAGHLQHGPRSQFTADAFTGAVEASGARVSMDGVGRWRDNVVIERFWRSPLEHLEQLENAQMVA